MDVFDRKCHLDKPIENLVFTVLDLTNFLLISYLRIEITTVCIVHNYTQTSLVHERLLVGDDIGVSHGFEHMYFIYCILSLLSIHL